MTMRASGRASRNASTTLSPLPSSSRMSSTANAGGRLRTAASASETDSTSVVWKPRLSRARPRRLRKGASSSSSSSDFSGRSEIADSMLVMSYRSRLLWPIASTPAKVPSSRVTDGDFKSGQLRSEEGRRLDPGPVPSGRDDRPAPPPVAKLDLGAGPLQQRLGDEEAQP